MHHIATPATCSLAPKSTTLSTSVDNSGREIMAEQRDVEFVVEGNVTLRAWLFVPDGPGPHAAVTMAHGFAGIREHGLDEFAQVYAEAGFAVLVHDHRGFGASDGQPRCDVDPWRQTDDPASVGHTRQYLLDVQRVLDEKQTPVKYFDQMLALYPDRLNPGPVWAGAVAPLC